MYKHLATWLCYAVFATAICQTSFIHSEEPPTSPSDQNSPSSDTERGQASPEMREMAKSMKSMADMCQAMMQREMQQRPLLIAVGATLGSLLGVALVLFVVLEVQWIRFWSLRIKSERKSLG